MAIGSGVKRHGNHSHSKNAWLRSGIIAFIVLFVWLQLAFLSIGDGSSSNGGNGGSASGLSSGSNDNDTAAILSMVPAVLHKFLTPSRPNQFILNNHSNFNSNHSQSPSATEDQLNPVTQQPLSIAYMKHNIALYNQLQTVLNEDAFGPLRDDSVVVVVQVHDRITYLRHLIVSLAQARDISQALIVFSHDYYDEEINRLVRSIDFCRVMQIFYPYSIQVHPHEFPGEDPNDCPRDLRREQALGRRCNNAPYPDLYGHYREARFTQTKHHWWWKANRVFNQLEATRNHTGLVLFLEEDHYVAEDFIVLLKLMERTCQASCRQCNVLSLGTYLKTYNYYGDTSKKEVIRAMKQQNGVVSIGQIQPQWSFKVLPSLYQRSQKVEITPWVSSKHNMGMALNRSTWRQIAACAEHFCRYDDYNWDWSLQQVSQQCLRQKLHAMVARGPRVFHIGECGVHHRKRNCESTAVIAKVQRVLLGARRHLYPRHLTLSYVMPLKKSKLRKGNGGWGDRRDHMLCMGMTLR